MWRSRSGPSAAVRAQRPDQRRLGGRRGRGGEARGLALGRRLRRRPARGAQLAAARPARPVGVVEQVGDVVDQQRPDRGRALVVGRVPGQREPLGRARDRRVEEQALDVELVLVEAQPQPGRGVDRAALVVAQERLGPRGRREHALVAAEHEQRPDAARAQRLRLGDDDAAGGRLRPDVDLEVVDGVDERRRVRLQLGRELGQLAQRAAGLGGDARVQLALGVEDVRLAAVGRGEQQRGLGRDALGQRRGRRRCHRRC